MRTSSLASCLLGVIGGVNLLACALPAQAARWVDVAVINRSTGERLTPYRHQGKLYVAGTPGERYGIELGNKDGRRVMTVISVDGVNVLTGQTAAPLQSGYVLASKERYSINGWRKNMDEVAQFYFTALPDSYAARTGRPDNVGVIGVAVYREQLPPPVLMPYPASRLESPGRESDAAQAKDGRRDRLAGGPAPAAAPPAPTLAQASGAGSGKLAAAESSTAGDSAARHEERGQLAEKKTAQRLGTGHGEREHAPTQSTEFTRASDTPDEIVTIYYDSRPNLIARGIIRAPRLAEPQPFPGGFVPDPGA